MALDLLLGFTGLLSFGHAAFWGSSAYATGLVFVVVVLLFRRGLLGTARHWLLVRRRGRQAVVDPEPGVRPASEPEAEPVRRRGVGAPAQVRTGGRIDPLTRDRRPAPPRWITFTNRTTTVRRTLGGRPVARLVNVTAISRDPPRGPRPAPRSALATVGAR